MYVHRTVASANDRQEFLISEKCVNGLKKEHTHRERTADKGTNRKSERFDLRNELQGKTSFLTHIISVFPNILEFGELAKIE